MNDGTTHALAAAINALMKSGGRRTFNVSVGTAGFTVFGLFIGLGGVGVFPLHWNARRQRVSVTTRRPVVLISLSGVVEF